MKKSTFLLLLTLINPTIIYAADNKVTGSIIKEDFIECFEENLMTKDNKPVYCETSGAIYTDDNKIIVVNDKPIPGHSPIFTLNYPELSVDEDLDIDTIQNLIKYEDITKTLDNQYIIATTAFDRIKPESDEWDKYNGIVYWKSSDPETAKVISTSLDAKNSIDLRPKIAAALNNSPYFKIEGITVIPDNKLLLGVRESGKKWNDFNYVIKIISVGFTINKEEKIILDDNFKLEYDFDISKYPNQEISKLKMGLSGLTYDKENKSLYILTGYENEAEKKVNGLLWRLSLSDFKSNNNPLLVTDKKGQPLYFSHKSEGLTMIEKNKIFVIHDDDNIEVGKKSNQAAYSIVDVF